MGTGGTSESFQVVGTLNLEKEQSKTSAIGAARISAYAFRTQFGKSSGPPAREEIFRDFRETGPWPDVLAVPHSLLAYFHQL